MKYIKYLGVAIYCLAATTLLATDFEPYQWEKDRPRYKLSEKDNSLSELILKQHTQYEYVFLGPKRREGDSQIPEGVYYINHFNPQNYLC